VVVGTTVLKPRFPGLGAQNPIFSTEKLGMFNPGKGIGAISKPLFYVKGFSSQAFAAIPKLGQQGEEKVSMDGESSMDSLVQLSGSQRLAAVLLIQPCKKAKMVENLDSSKGLEFAVIPHLALADNNGRIILSPAKKEEREAFGSQE
jgi:hypothetical protein